MMNRRFNLEYMGPRRRSPKWKRPASLALWIFVILLVISLWLYGLWLQKYGAFGAAVSQPVMPVLRAGFPDWVAWGVLGTAVLLTLGVLAYRSIFAEAWNEEDGLPVTVEGEMNTQLRGSAEPWMHELMGVFARRSALITEIHCRQIRALCVPRHRLDLVALDAYLRREVGLRLFVTTLLEVQAICAKADEDGKEGAGV